MIDSGELLALRDVGRPLVDKHSTGGVGDKITLPLAPLVAACGAAVPQLSGRGLGHTGGTLDKLESIPGWRAELSLDEIAAQLADVGAVICATTPTLAPADRKLYALRDVTGTVEAIPLIASSIMSKKIAEGTGGLVLDVKVGSGAFMKSPERARELAETMVDSAPRTACAPRRVLTDMSVPLGRAVGNALEVAESVEVLRGGGPADVVELTVALAREMLALAGVDADPAAVLASGAAYPVWERMIAAQGGDPAAPLPVAPHVEEVAPTGRAWSGWTRWRSASPPGGWGRAGRARSTPCRRRRGCCCSSTPATRWPPGSRCWSCTPTPRTRWRARAPLWRRGRRRRRPGAAAPAADRRHPPPLTAPTGARPGVCTNAELAYRERKTRVPDREPCENGRLAYRARRSRLAAVGRRARARRRGVLRLRTRTRRSCTQARRAISRRGRR